MNLYFYLLFDILCHFINTRHNLVMAQSIEFNIIAILMSCHVASVICFFSNEYDILP